MVETVEVLLSSEDIAKRIKELGAQITKDYEGKSVVLLGVLKGAIHFTSDLSRELPLDVEINFIKPSSYGDGTVSSGTVSLDYIPTENLKDRHVIIVEDIVDTGHTAVKLKDYFADQGLASLKFCALLDKPDRREAKDLTIDYLGFAIPDKFVIGYGLDYAQRYRNLPYVGVLKGAS
ncbi:MAG: hypoxanthine phosphoribosyltransferase [Defluviitaleaceae bacterium]|nr:hypoxanthine phosphoribosyltransferase [Defluviitaleaceae bacterium]